MNHACNDLRYAGRALRRNPGFAFLVIATMAIGVGANTAIFSVVNSVLLRPLPFADPNALVLVSQVDRRSGRGSGDATPANFLDWRARNRSFAGLAAYRNSGYALSSGDLPERVAGAIVNANFFEVLGAKPLHGRTFQPGDEGSGAARVAIITKSLWQQRFGSRADVIGQSVRLNGEPHTIIGIMPAGIEFPDESQVWTTPHWPVPDDPLALNEDPSAQRGHGYLFVLGRLRAGMSRAEAQHDMDTVAQSLEHDYPDDDRDAGIRLVPLHEELVRDARPVLLVLFAAVGVLLLIATANVSGLLLARATARHQEIAIRVALGATRRRIVGQLLTESTLLGLAGGAGGVIVAMWVVAPLASLAPANLATGELHLDLSVLLFATTVSIAAGILFGLAPARQLLRPSVHADLKETSRGTASGEQRRVRSALVAAEIALALVLLVGAGLTIKSFVRLLHVPAGFDTDRVFTLSATLPQLRYPTATDRADFWQRALAEVKRIPGVEAVGAASRLPLSGGNSTRGITIDGRALTPPATADYRTASPEYFRALGIPLISGRTFREDDAESRPLVAIVSQVMARRFWQREDPIGRRVSIDGEHQLTIVGVVGDVHHASLDALPQPTFYVPYRQDPWPSMSFVVRAAASPAALAAATQVAIWRVDKDQPLSAIQTMDERLSLSIARRRFSVTLLSAFAIIAGMLAAIGLYGVIAFVVAQRRREFGVRMALGAQSRDIVADVMRNGLQLAGLGIAAGFALAIGATRLINALLFGTSPTDAGTFAAVVALLAIVAAAACLIPALRASRLDPITALRDE